MTKEKSKKELKQTKHLFLVATLFFIGAIVLGSYSQTECRYIPPIYVPTEDGSIIPVGGGQSCYVVHPYGAVAGLLYITTFVFFGSGVIMLIHIGARGIKSQTSQQEDVPPPPPPSSDFGYCQYCGAELGQGLFCPACGKSSV